MSLDASFTRQQQQQGPHDTNANQGGTSNININTQQTGTLESIMLTMIEENRRRDSQRDRLIEELFRRLQLSSQAPNNTMPTPQNFQSIPDLTKSIQLFTGNESSSQAREWLSNIESMILLHGWPGNFALDIARSNLTLGAAQWFCTRRAELTNWNAFNTTFRNTFIRDDGTIARWKKMVERVQQRAEPLQQYILSEETLCRDLNLDFTNTKEQILIGLWSKDLFNTIHQSTR